MVTDTASEVPQLIVVGVFLVGVVVAIAVGIWWTVHVSRARTTARAQIRTLADTQGVDVEGPVVVPLLTTVRTLLEWYRPATLTVDGGAVVLACGNKEVLRAPVSEVRVELAFLGEDSVLPTVVLRRGRWRRNLFPPQARDRQDPSDNDAQQQAVAALLGQVQLALLSQTPDVT